MAHLRPVPAAQDTSEITFVHKDLHNCTHLFLWAINMPGSGAHLAEREKTLQHLFCGKPITVSADRVKPTYMLNVADCWSITFIPSASAT
jgi:hypothetical protein